VRKPPPTLVAFTIDICHPCGLRLQGGRVPLVRVWERSLCPTDWRSPPVCLLNAGLVALGAGTPPQGANVNTPPQRLLARGQGTGQQRGSRKPPPWPWGR
jgi:hypothetical protein